MGGVRVPLGDHQAIVDRHRVFHDLGTGESAPAARRLTRRATGSWTAAAGPSASASFSTSDRTHSVGDAHNPASLPPDTTVGCVVRSRIVPICLTVVLTLSVHLAVSQAPGGDGPSELPLTKDQDVAGDYRINYLSVAWILGVS